MSKIRTEPALVVGVVQAILALVVAFGLPLSDEQSTAVLGLAGAVLAIVGAVTVRAQVTPDVKLAAAAPDVVAPARARRRKAAGRPVVKAPVHHDPTEHIGDPYDGPRE